MNQTYEHFSSGEVAVSVGVIITEAIINALIVVRIIILETIVVIPKMPAPLLAPVLTIVGAVITNATNINHPHRQHHQ